MYVLAPKKSLRLGVSLRSLTWSLTTPFAYLESHHSVRLPVYQTFRSLRLAT